MMYQIVLMYLTFFVTQIKLIHQGKGVVKVWVQPVLWKLQK